MPRTSSVSGTVSHSQHSTVSPTLSRHNYHLKILLVQAVEQLWLLQDFLRPDECGQGGSWCGKIEYEPFPQLQYAFLLRRGTNHQLPIGSSDADEHLPRRVTFQQLRLVLRSCNSKPPAICWRHAPTSSFADNQQQRSLGVFHVRRNPPGQI